MIVVAGLAGRHKRHRKFPLDQNPVLFPLTHLVVMLQFILYTKQILFTLLYGNLE